MTFEGGKSCFAAFLLGAVLGWPSLWATEFAGEGHAGMGAEPEVEAGEVAELTDEEARAMVEQIVGKVEQIRDLRFKREVTVSLVDDDQAREHIIRRFRKFQPEAKLAWEQQALALLGILPAGIDVLEEYLDLLREQAGGFYDPATKAFFLLDDMPRVMAPLLASHELTHALEDQHYDLDARLTEALANDDLVFARSAVHEGSAMLLMAVYLTGAMVEGSLTPSDLVEIANAEAARGEKLAGFPEALLRPLLGSYILGARFLIGGDLGLLTSQGYPAARVDQTYKDGPRSSEQILHPEKYWDPDQRDEPTAVRLGKAGRVLGRRWKRRGDGVLGELMLGLMVGATTPRDPTSMFGVGGEAWTNEAASGWDGDRWELWTKGDATVVLLTTVWDSPNDAEEFAGTLQQREGLSWSRCIDLVAVVGGDAGRKAEKLLDRMLQEMGCTAATGRP